MGDLSDESTISKSLKPLQVITVTNQYEDQDRMENFRQKTPILKRVIVVLLFIFVSVISLWFALWLIQSKPQSLTEVYYKLEAISDSIRVQFKRFGLQQNQTIDDTTMNATMLDNDAFDSNPKNQVPDGAEDDMILSSPLSLFASFFKIIGLPENRIIEDTALNKTMLNNDALNSDPKVKDAEKDKEDMIKSSSSSSFGEYSKMILKLDMKKYLPA